MQKWKKNHFNLFLNKNYFETCTGHTHAITCCRSFKIQPGPTGWPGARDWNRAGLKKKQEKKKPGVTRSKTRLQPVNFCFSTKTMLFWFFKKIIINPGRSGDSVKTRKPCLGYDRSKNYACCFSFMFRSN